jgi:hypothetical protein
MSLCLPTDFPLWSKEITNDFKKGKHKEIKKEVRNDTRWIIFGWFPWNKFLSQVVSGVLSLQSPGHSMAVLMSPKVRDSKSRIWEKVRWGLKS